MMGYNRTCDAQKWLFPAIGRLDCNRERGHAGMHRDNAENLYWFPGAPPLEFVPVPNHTDGSSV